MARSSSEKRRICRRKAEAGTRGKRGGICEVGQRDRSAGDIRLFRVYARQCGVSCSIALNFGCEGRVSLRFSEGSCNFGYSYRHHRKIAGQTGNGEKPDAKEQDEQKEQKGNVA